MSAANATEAATTLTKWVQTSGQVAELLTNFLTIATKSGILAGGIIGVVWYGSDVRKLLNNWIASKHAEHEEKKKARLAREQGNKAKAREHEERADQEADKRKKAMKDIRQTVKKNLVPSVGDVDLGKHMSEAFELHQQMERARSQSPDVGGSSSKHRHHRKATPDLEEGRT